nr:MAG TPA: hypothetical protein [Caudoviricetes sp.]
MTTVDFGGTERTEDYYFNLTKAEIMEMQLCTDGGFVETVKKIVEAKNQLELTHLFKKIICASYGVLSPDGRKFVKNQQVLDDFMATQAYSDLYIELLSGDGKAAEDFVNGILPKDLTNEAAKAPVSQPGLAVLNP